MNYFLWEDLTAKYPILSKDFGAAAVNSFWAQAASADVDALVGKRFTVPFTPTPFFIKNLAIDLCYWEMTYKEEDQSILKDYIDERVTGLVNGTITLTDPSGNQIAAAATVFLTTSGTISSFGMDSPTNFEVDSGWQQGFQQARGQFCD